MGMLTHSSNTEFTIMRGYLSLYTPKDQRAYDLMDRIEKNCKLLGISRNAVLWTMIYESRRKLNRILKQLQGGKDDERTRKKYLRKIGR